jgi:hypothetical protein
MNPRLTYHIELLKNLATELAKLSDADQAFNQNNTILPQFDALIEQLKQPSVEQTDAAMFEGAQWMYRFLTLNPELAPAIHRDLLWFFGGECLHFMPDEEIERFQRLDDMEADALASGADFDRQQAKASIFKSH